MKISGIKHIIKEEIIREVSLDQLKKDFVDAGKIPPEDFEEISDISHKSAYITWLIKRVYDGLIKQEDVYKWKKYFSIFDRNKQKYPSPDINFYRTPDDINMFIKTTINIIDSIKKDPSQDKGVSKWDKYQEFYLGDDDGFKVYEIPKGREDLYGMSCDLGGGTE